MIPLSLVHRLAKDKGVPETSIIRDYAQNHLLDALFHHRPFMVFKGGTCLRKIFYPDYRFSDDLDFTLISDIKPADISTTIADSLRSARKTSGISFEDNFRTETTESGIDYDTYFVYGPLNLRMKIKLDITQKENERILLPVQYRPLHHPYPDKLDAIIPVYSIEEMMAEKIRSLFQRTRPRDLYDVWFMQENSVRIADIIIDKFSYKKVDFHIPDLIGKRTDFEKAWTNSLIHQMKNVPDFDTVFDTVVRGLQSTESKR